MSASLGIISLITNISNSSNRSRVMAAFKEIQRAKVPKNRSLFKN